ncbi:AT1B [Acrasis kona]|uniref:AT1B n=1 Tax=Acrasis kona TaxID=1008807 RepID=A0AAW2YLS6_9EUKA
MTVLNKLHLAEALFINILTGVFVILKPDLFLETLSPDQILDQVQGGHLAQAAIGLFGVIMVVLGLLEIVIFVLGSVTAQRIASACLLFGDLLHLLWVYNTFKLYSGNHRQILSNSIPTSLCILLRICFLLSSKVDVKQKK